MCLAGQRILQDRLNVPIRLASLVNFSPRALHTSDQLEGPGGGQPWTVLQIET